MEASTVARIVVNEVMSRFGCLVPSTLIREGVLSALVTEIYMYMLEISYIRDQSHIIHSQVL